MKYILLFSLATSMIFSCAKKTVPAATATSTAPPPTVTEPTKAPDEMKINTAADIKNSKEAVAGMETYNAKCGRCHELKNTTEWTREEWVPILNSMARKARLDSAEKAHVLVYVQSHAKDV